MQNHRDLVDFQCSDTFLGAYAEEGLIPNPFLALLDRPGRDEEVLKELEAIKETLASLQKSANDKESETPSYKPYYEHRPKARRKEVY